MGTRGEAFARWYYARGKGQQYLLRLIPVVVAIIAMKLIIPLLPEQELEWRGTVPCPTRTDVYISRADPLFDENDLEGTVHRACARAGDPR